MQSNTIFTKRRKQQVIISWVQAQLTSSLQEYATIHVLKSHSLPITWMVGPNSFPTLKFIAEKRNKTTPNCTAPSLREATQPLLPQQTLNLQFNNTKKSIY